MTTKTVKFGSDETMTACTELTFGIDRDMTTLFINIGMAINTAMK
jgi:hypothetical protein